MTPLPGSTSLRLGLVAIIAALLAFGLWVTLAPLHGAIISAGLVKSAHNRKLVQHTDGGIVKRILVSNGDKVSVGQTLIELEDIKVDANLQLLQELLIYEAVRRDRLDAEQQLAKRFLLSADYQNHHALITVDKAYQRELKIFQTRRTLLEEQQSGYQRQLVAIAPEQSALRDQADASRNAARLARDELAINEGLARDKFISRARLLTLERAVSEYGARQGEHEAALAQSEQRKNDIALRKASVRAEYQRMAAEEFKDSHARFVQLREQLRPLEDAARRKSVVAPVAGKVVGLRINTAGEVAAPREALMEIVPTDEDLIVEAHVGVDAIRHLRLNQTAELRFTTFNSRTTPLVDGTLSYISADAIIDKNGIPYYIIQVKPQLDSLANAKIPSLTPGMATEVYVLLEARSVINYLFTPITDVLRRTLREP